MSQNSTQRGWSEVTVSKIELHAAPLGAFPGGVRLNPKHVRHERAKSAQRRDETDLAELLRACEIELRAVEIGRAMLLASSALLETACVIAPKASSDDEWRVTAAAS